MQPNPKYEYQVHPNSYSAHHAATDNTFLRKQIGLISDISGKEVIKTVNENLQSQCICPQCPTYIQCDEPKGFCLPGVSPSKCIKVRNGCLCPACPVAEQMGYEGEFFCIALAGQK